MQGPYHAMGNNPVSLLDSRGTRPFGDQGGSYVWKSSSYSAQRALAEEAATASELAKGAGRTLGLISVGYSAYEFAKDPTLGRGLETAISIISMVPGWGWAVGGIYFVADMSWKAYSGKTIQQSIDNE